MALSDRNAESLNGYPFYVPLESNDPLSVARRVESRWSTIITLKGVFPDRIGTPFVTSSELPLVVPRPVPAGTKCDRLWSPFAVFLVMFTSIPVFPEVSIVSRPSIKQAVLSTLWWGHPLVLYRIPFSKFAWLVGKSV